ncbi:hypothetical protein ACJQWK_04708 [Exserohilum turcicum]
MPAGSLPPPAVILDRPIQNLLPELVCIYPRRCLPRLALQHPVLLPLLFLLRLKLLPYYPAHRTPTPQLLV